MTTPAPATIIHPDDASELLDVFTRLDAAAQRASAQIASAIVAHGSPVVAEALGVCHQTALRWARHGMKVPTASPTHHIEAVLQSAQVRPPETRSAETTGLPDPEPLGL